MLGRPSFELVRYNDIHDMRRVGSLVSTLADTLGTTSLQDILAAIAKSALDEAMIAGLEIRRADMTMKLDRLHVRAKRKRALALRVMAGAGMRKLVKPNFTICFPLTVRFSLKGFSLCILETAATQGR
jgi:hypothetical protein